MSESKLALLAAHNEEELGLLAELLGFLSAWRRSASDPPDDLERAQAAFDTQVSQFTEWLRGLAAQT